MKLSTVHRGCFSSVYINSKFKRVKIKIQHDIIILRLYINNIKVINNYNFIYIAPFYTE